MGKKARNRCFVCRAEFKQREGGSGEQTCPVCSSRTVARLVKPSPPATASAGSQPKRKHDIDAEPRPADAVRTDAGASRSGKQFGMEEEANQPSRSSK